MNFLEQDVRLVSKEEVKKFNVHTDRLDSLFNSVCSKEKYPRLWDMLKMVLIMSHGQADVERGFSVNKVNLYLHSLNLFCNCDIFNLDNILDK